MASSDYPTGGRSVPTVWISLAVAVAAAVCALGAAAAPGGKRYRSAFFSPAFTVVLPAGWVVAERDVGGAQMFRQCGDCPANGELNGEVTLDMALATLSLSKAINVLRSGISNVAAGPLTPVSIGSLRGEGFSARRTGKAIEFPRSGYHTEGKGAPLRVMVVKGGGRTVTVILDAPTARAPKFMADATAALKTLRFAG